MVNELCQMLRPDPFYALLRFDALLAEMRKRLQTEIGYEKYLQRLWTTEPFFGHLKYHLGYRHFFLRSLDKVKGEFRLMCMGWNLKKGHKMLVYG